MTAGKETAEISPFPLEELIEQIKSVNSQIAGLLGAKDGTDDKQLGQLHLNKASLTVDALERRRNGQQGINITLYGRSQDLLHAYSRNRANIRFTHPDTGSPYVTTIHLDLLRAKFKGDMASLIGQPDQIIAEHPLRDFIVRTINEIHEISRAIGGKDLANSLEPEKLRVRLAERILELRANNKELRKEIEIVHLFNKYRIVFQDKPDRQGVGFELWLPLDYDKLSIKNNLGKYLSSA